ncbi:hypothetical protein TNCV_445441 [Trichonephila clavipes]|nr:hypothetical protein TNCV_445441 [Trichonephila clavipes]
MRIDGYLEQCSATFFIAADRSKLDNFTAARRGFISFVFVVAYTDGLSDISLIEGEAGILFQLPNKERKMHQINTGLIASNFTSELLAIKEAPILYSTHMELSGTTEGLAISSDSRAALEAIIKGDRNITSAINVLLESMKILSDKTRSYIPCKNSTEAQLTPDHILECPALTPHIIPLGMVPLALESADAPRLAEVVQRAHDII